MTNTTLDPKLRDYASDVQKKHFDAYMEHGSYQKAARALGLKSKNAVQDSITRLKARAAREFGYAPGHFESGVAPGFSMGKVTVQRGPGGEVERTWERQSPDQERQAEMMREAFAALAEELPRLPRQKYAGPVGNGDLLNCFVITDFHMGALSWAAETGADWNLDIAEQTLVAWFERAIAQSPNAKTALLAQISDLLHWDGFDAVTPASKHLLDADTRFPKLVRIAIRVLRRVIDMLLAKHERLHIIMADANHDPVSQVWLREWIAVLYENNPRVTVDTSPSPYNAYEFGKVAIFTHHGHKRRMSNVSEVFAAQFREMFGRTRFAYAHTGHLHHVDVKENNLMIVEQHRTLAAPDAYAARGGWITGRDAKVITYHREYGEVGRITVSFDMIKGQLKVAA
jgi:hypothetical protein